MVLDELSIQISTNARSAITSIKNLTTAISALSSAVSDVDVANISNMSKVIGRTSAKLGELAQNKEAVNTIKAVGRALKEVNKNSKVLDELAGKLDGTRQSGDELASSFSRVGSQVGDAFQPPAVISQWTVELRKMWVEMANLGKNSEISNVKLAKMLETMSYLLQYGKYMQMAFGDGVLKIGKNKDEIIPVGEMSNALATMEELTRASEEFRRVFFSDLYSKIQFNVDEESAETTKADIEEIITEFGKLNLTAEELSRRRRKIELADFKSLFDSIKQVGTALDNIVQKVKNFASSIANAFGSGISKIKNFARSFFTVNDSVRKTKKGIDSLDVRLSKLFRSLTRISKMLRLMITRKILQAIIRNAIDGFKNMVQYSDKFNQSVSLLWNSFRQLGNASASMIAPLLNAFAPALNKIIQLLVEACNWVNQLFSALTGATSWSKAKVLTDSYAESLDSTASSAKKANKQLQSFDALNNLTTQDDSGKATNPSDMFEEKEVESKFKDLAEKLKDIWDKILAPLKKAWDNVGQHLVDSLKKTWAKLKRLFKRIGDDFLKVWNEDKTVKVFENIIEIIAGIVDIVGILADKFYEAWVHNENGIRFLEAIRDILYVITDWILKAVNATKDWAEQLDLKPLFSSITDYVESLVGVVDAVMEGLYNFYTIVLLPLSKWVLEDGLPQLFDIFTKMNNDINWDRINDSLKKLFEALEPFGEKIGQGLIDFIGYMTEKVTEFLNSNLFTKIIDSITDFVDYINNTDFSFDTSNLDESFTKWLESLEPVVDSIAGIFKDFYSEFLMPIADWTIGVGLPKLLDCFTELNNIGLFDDLRDALRDLWQILTPFAQKVGEGLIIFIEDAGKAVHEFFGSDEWKKFVDSMKSFVNDVKPQQIADGLTKIFKALLAYGMIKTVITVFTPIVSFISSIISFGSKVAEIAKVTGAIENLAGAFGTLGTALSVLADNVFVIENIKELISESKKLGEIDDSLTPFVKGNATEEDVKKLAESVEELNQASKDVEESSKNWGGFFKELFLGDVAKAGEIYRELTNYSNAYADELSELRNQLYIGKISQSEYNEKLEELYPLYSKSKGASETLTKEVENVSAEVAKAGGEMSGTLITLEKNVDNSTGNIVSTMKDVKPEFSEKNWTFEDVAKGLEETFRSAYSRVTKLLEQLREKLKWEIGQLKLNMTSFVDWIEKEIFPNFSKETWTFSGLAEGLSDSFDSAIKICKQKWNAFAKELNSMVELTVDPISMNGENIYEGGQFKLFTLPTFSTGGFPENGLFMANSTEMVGKFSNGKNAVANNEQIVDGIAQGVASANSEQNMLLRQQNSLLQAILEKETGISSDALFRSVQNSANSYYKRTGRYAFN